MIGLHERRSELLKCGIEPLTHLADTFPMDLVAADVSPRTLSPMRVSADLRRRLRFKGSTREILFWGNLSPFGGVTGASALIWQIK